MHSMESTEGAWRSSASLPNDGVLRTVGPVSVLGWYQWVDTPRLCSRASQDKTDQSIMLAGSDSDCPSLLLFHFPRSGRCLFVT